MESVNRPIPTLVSALAIFHFLFAVGLLLFAWGMLLTMGPEFLLTFLLMPITMSGGIVFFGAVGFGLWKLRNWARILVIGEAVLGFVIGLYALPVLLLLCPLIVWYMFRSHVIRAFDGPAAQ